METEETIAERLEYLEDCMEEVWKPNERQKQYFRCSTCSARLLACRG